MAILGWAHVTLTVTDHDRSVGWYEQVLGFEPTATQHRPSWVRTLCMHRDGSAILVLQQHLPGAVERFDERRPGLDHLALGVATRTELEEWQERLAELEEWQERLAELGVDYSPIADAGRGGLALSFRDPDGIALELFHRPQNAYEGD
ncbi:VOC family protein [Actinomadura violacea]|uniref:VOC family protein n=1 Tax=Actinomadura violacea TaxID=2819934 RepID=A0ABS3RGW0_9ACTN|nr:VOC family protein [Actinomadura violacea]MBO2455967.1 VOC family protein [Actinomadura violacea]